MFSQEQALGMREFLMQGVNWETEVTKKVVAAIPADKLDYKLGEKGRTAAELAWHIITADIWFLEGIAALKFSDDGGDGQPQPATTAEMLAHYNEKLAAGVAKVSAMTGAQLATPIDFYGMMNLPAVSYLSFLSNHQIHHRGQLSTYLRAMNAHVPSIYGGSADEPFTAGASA